MGLFEHWPYVNFHDLNLDWIIKEIPKVFASRDEAQASAEASAESAAASQLSADAALASQEAAHQSELNAEQSAENAAESAQDAAETVAATTEQMALLQSRVDNIIPSGTQTEGNTELIDVRVTYYNETYDSAGNSVRGQCNNLNDKIHDYINGTNKTLNVTETGSKFFNLLLLKGVTYKLVNNTSAGCEVNYRKKDGTNELISGGLNPNIPIFFTPDNDYAGLAFYFNGTGTVTLSNGFSSLKQFESIDSSINSGIYQLGYLLNGKYVTSAGDLANDAGWSATDFIALGDLCEELKVNSPASSGGTYNAFYDADKNFISNFAIATGSNTIPIPENAVYVRLSNTTTNITQYKIENIIGYLNRKISEEIDRSSIYELNINENMVVNAGANYGYHAGGQSNVNKRFSILITTDPHGDAVGMRRSIEYINDMQCFDCGCTLGDLQANTFSDNDGTWYTNEIRNSSKPWLTIIGNHDVGLGTNPATTGDLEEVYNKFILPNMPYAAVTPTGNNYYYKDFATYKIRVICLNAYDVNNDALVDGQYLVPRYTEYYSQDQITWLTTLLTNTPNDYHVMILTHNTPAPSVKDTSVEFNNAIYSFSPEGTQNGIVAKIINAWKNKTTLNQVFTCSNQYLDSVTVNVDYSGRTESNFIAFVTGHMHVDAIGHITQYPTLNVFTYAATNTGTYQNDWSDLPRADGTKSEDCITALSVDTTDRKIYISRIGSSVSRFFHNRKPSVISY